MNEQTNPEVAILNAALELPADQRAVYLAAACAGDAVLRQQVEALLHAHCQAGEFMETQPAGPDFKRTVRVSIPLAASPGEKIGRYKLLQLIGEGGCGVVYMAEQEEPVRRRVALKLIKPGMDTRQVITRFEAERQALALMDHPNIAKVLDAGATDAGRPYFVMELVRGIKITEFCDENKISTEERLKLFVQICQAIQHAHQKGIIHRDIKPSNILITINDGVPVPKVIDFGIAKATQGRLTDKTLFTAFDQFIGTPTYMSPEQAVMTSQDIDTRSDIYSLGVLLYELLTGTTPFDAKELLRAGYDEMRRTIREREPARPSTRLGTMLKGELSTTAKHRHTDAPKLIHLLRGDIDWIVMKCLEKDRARRYETANGLARDIERHLNNEPVAARPPTTLYRFQKLARRNKLIFAAVAGVAAALLIGLTVSTWMYFRERAARTEQGRLRVQAQTEAARSRQVAQFLKEMLKGVERSVALGRDSKMIREVLDDTTTRVSRDLNSLPDVEAELRVTVGDVYQLLGELPIAETMYRRALELQRKIGGDSQPEVAQLLNNLGVTLLGEDRPAEAETLHREALALRRRLLEPKDPAVAESLHNLASLLRRRGNLPEAEAAIREALSIRLEKLGRSHRAVAESMQGLAIILMRQGKSTEAEPLMREALALQTQLLGTDHPVVADMTEDLGLVLAEQGKNIEAENTLRTALSKRRQLQGDAHPDTLICMAMLLNSLLAEEKYAEAEPIARDCLKIREEKSPGDARTYNTRSLLGGCLLGLKRYEEAEPLLLSGYEGLKRKQTEERIPWEGQYVVTNALKRIVRLYEVTNQPDTAATWRQKLTEAEKISGVRPAGQN